jgi:hypothetical protein
MDIEVAPRKRHQRPGTGSTIRQVRRRTRRLGDTWCLGRRRSENLGMDAVGGDTSGREASGEIAHKAGRSAQIEIGVARHAQPLQYPQVQASGSVEIDSPLVHETGRAVADVAVAAG